MTKAVELFDGFLNCGTLIIAGFLLALCCDMCYINNVRNDKRQETKNKRKEERIMNITVDKNYTEKAFNSQVKADIKSFKSVFNEHDLLWALSEKTGKTFYEMNILMFEGAAFPGGYAFDNETHFCFNVILSSRKTMYRIIFYCNMNLEITEKTSFGSNMITIDEYKHI